MKIKKLGKILAILFTFALLCGCTDNSAGASNKNSTENSTSPDPVNSSDVSSQNSGETASNTSSTPEPGPVDIGNGMTLTGTPLDNSELEEFSLELYSNYVFDESDEEFFDSLEIPQLYDLYKRAERLFSLAFSTSGIKPTFAAVGNGRKPARIEITNPDGAYVKALEESGYTYESFYNVYLNAFTKETTEELFKKYSHFLNYNGSMFIQDTASGGNIWIGNPAEVHREFELISKSDDVIEFEKTSFYHNMDFKPATEYIPELRDKYDVEHLNLKFVLTEDGWRMSLEKSIFETE